MKPSLLILSIGLFVLNVTINAVADSEHIPTLKAPKIIKRGPILYPGAALKRNQEGWVELETMVDRNGKPFDAVVVDAVGHAGFVRAAIRSLKRTTFEPGEYQGEKVDGVSRLKVVFSMHDNSAAFFGLFKTRFTETVSAIEVGDESDARSRLEELRDQTKTLYEDAMYWTARLYFERKWGTQTQQLSSVNRALAYNEAPRHLDANLFEQLQWSKLELQIQLGHYGEALRTIKVLEKLEGLDESRLAHLGQYRNSIEDLRVAEKAYSVNGLLDKEGRWKYVLLRNQFAVADVKGVINEFQLYCQRQLVRFRFEPELEYRLDNTNGTCRLWTIGKPNTEFKLIQL